MRRKCSSQEEELDSLKKLLHHIRTSSPEEVGKIVAYIRLYEDPVAAFNSYFSSTAAMYPTTEVGDETNETSECQIDSQCNSESGAFPTRGGRVRAEALPPNTVASSEVVSDLISQYFIIERPLSLPSVDCQTFIDGINKGDTSTATGSHCSDLLVNAMCAQQCVCSSVLFLSFANYPQHYSLVLNPSFLPIFLIRYYGAASFYQTNTVEAQSPNGI